jgi:hypothetical protein
MMIILDIWGPGLAYAFGIFLVIILLFLLNFTLFLIYLFKNKYIYKNVDISNTKKLNKNSKNSKIISNN